MSIPQYIKQFTLANLVFMMALFLLLSSVSHGQTPFEKIIKISQDSAKVLLASTTDEETICLATYQIGRKYMRYNGDSSITYIMQAIEMAEALDNAVLVNRMKKTLTFPLIDAQQMRRAEEILYEIKPFFQTYRDGELYESWCSNIGYLMTENARYEEAIIYLTEALKIANKNEKFKVVNSLLNHIGIVYGRLGAHGRALEYYEKIIYNCEELDRVSMYSAALGNAASILKEIGEDEKALKYFNQVIDIRKEHKSVHMKYSVLNAQSSAAELQNNIQKAIDYSNRALEITITSNRKQDMLSQYLRLQELYEKDGNIKLADDYLEKAYALQGSLKNLRNQSKVLSRYAKLMSRKGDFKTAYSTQTMLDSLIQNRKLGEAEDRVIKLEISEINRLREIELETLRNDSKTIKLQLDKKENERLFLIVLSLLLLGIIGLVLKNNQNRKKTNRELEEKNSIINKNLNEKNTLMKEIHHRVKNNLQIVSSMLSLQLRYINDDNTKKVVSESRDRVKSMALIHQKLYQEDNLKGVFMPTYIESLLLSLAHSYKLDSLSIDLDYDVIDIWIDVDTAMPIGMIINELTTNAIKHAFTEKGGKINVRLFKKQDELVLSISDNGIGMEQPFVISDQECFGFKMINSFVRKLKGELKVSSDNGTQIKIIIKRFNEIKL